MQFSVISWFCSNKQPLSVQEPPPVTKEFRVAGSGSAVPIMRKLAERYNQKYGENIQIPEGISSKGGMEAVKNGAIDLGLTARPPLTEAEKKMGLVQLVFARIGVIVGVNPNVTENDLSGQQLVDIYNAKKTKWQDNQEIVVLLKENGDIVPTKFWKIKYRVLSRPWLTHILRNAGKFAIVGYLA